MNNFYLDFIDLLEKENKLNALNLVLSRLEDRSIDIVTLYTDVLAPSLNSMDSISGDKLAIWREHVRSSIIRTIIENCYPHVIRERNERYRISTNKKIAVVCPSEEYHEIGARVISDFFTLLGYDSIFVGSNTPREEFLNAVHLMNLDYIALSISNYYNLVKASDTIQKIRATGAKVKIIVGGSAFKNNPHAAGEIGADIQLDSFEDIKKLAEEDIK